jgi:hypothetical protein
MIGPDTPEINHWANRDVKCPMGCLCVSQRAPDNVGHFLLHGHCLSVACVGVDNGNSAVRLMPAQQLLNPFYLFIRGRYGLFGMLLTVGIHRDFYDGIQ